MNQSMLPSDPTLRHVLSTAAELLSDSTGRLRLRVSGNSMAPLIQRGDLLHIQADRTPLIPGEVVVCREGEQLYAHRILRILRAADGDESYLTKGDASVHLDPRVGREQIIGKAIAIQRGERCLSLDGRGWRAVNWGLAQMMWIWARSYERRSPGHPFQGKLIYKAGEALFSTLLGVMAYLNRVGGSLARWLGKTRKNAPIK